MNNDMTHERCSELLGPYARNELAGDDRAALAAHLESCVDCRRELAGLKALLDHPVEGLTGTEVVRLDRAIAAAIGADRRRAAATITPLPERSESRSGLAGAVLTAAAVLVVAAIAVGSLITGGSEEDAGSDAVGVTSEDGAGAEGGSAEGPRPLFGGAQRDDAFTAFENDATGKEELTAALRSRALKRLGTSALFERFAAAYDTEDAVALQDRFVAELAGGAGDDAGTVTLCTRNVLEASTGPALPVAGQFGRFEGRPALALGFVYTDRSEGALNRYSIWVFPRGSCETPLSTAAGTVR